MTNNISILFDIKRLVEAEKMNNPYWGVTKYTSKLFENLKKDYFAIELIPVYFATLNIKTRRLDRLLRDLLLLRNVKKKIGKKIITRNKFPPTSFTKELFPVKRNKQNNFPVSANKIKNSQSGYDIYFSPITPLPPQNTLPPEIKRIITVHDVLHLKYPDLWPFPKKTPAIKKSIESINPNKDFVICVSDSTKQDLLSLINMEENRIRVIPNGADEIFFTRDRGYGQPLLKELNIKPKSYVFALAQSEKRKNISRLIQSYWSLELRNKIEEDLLLVANSEANKKKIRRFMIDKEIKSKKIKIISDVNNQLLASLYANAKLFIFISLYEGFGIPLIEAMASGCPVLASNKSSIPEVLDKAGIYVNDPRDISEISKKIYHTLKDNERLKLLSKKGISRAQQFTWENTAKKTSDFFVYTKNYQKDIKC